MLLRPFPFIFQWVQSEITIVAMLFRRIKNFVDFPSRLRAMEQSLARIGTQLDEAKILAAKTSIQHNERKGVVERLCEVEFKVFSQFGDDGIIQYLIHHLQPVPDSFIEFGVQDYRESNTRFLLLNNNWRGLVIDGREDYIRSIQNDDIYWRYTLTAHCAFIDRDNIDMLIRDAGFVGEVGLLSIDIDGNDYWIWEELSVVNPVIVIIEYNSIFGPNWAVTIPYDPTFVRHRAHFSGVFWGASLKALALLGERKGYSLIGCNSSGNNAYFVRKDRVGMFPVYSAEQAFVDARFRESRDKKGTLNFRTGEERFREIEAMEVYDVAHNQLIPLQALRNGEE